MQADGTVLILTYSNVYPQAQQYDHAKWYKTAKL